MIILAPHNLLAEVHVKLTDLALQSVSSGTT
jgi:hypothetical protein